MEKDNIFNEIFENLSAEDKVRLLDVLRQYPEYATHLIENYKKKKVGLESGDRESAQKIIEEEKKELINLINKNFELEENV